MPLKTRMMKLKKRREKIIKDHFNKVSADLIERCVEVGINEIILGYNKNWKEKSHMGRKQNDRFHKIPYRTLIHMIFNKAQEKGIIVIEHEEAFTSKCDALQWEDICEHDEYSGERLTPKHKHKRLHGKKPIGPTPKEERINWKKTKKEMSGRGLFSSGINTFRTFRKLINSDVN